MSDTILRAAARSFTRALVSQATGEFQVNPTLVEGDVQISIDESGFVNLTDLPVVAPVGSEIIIVSVTAIEADAAELVVRLQDVAGDEWEDLYLFITTHVPEVGVAGISAGTSLTDRSLLELRFGVVNIATWADLDNDLNAVTIAARIDQAINFATEDAYDKMRGGPITVPITGNIPFSLANHVAGLAGVWLYTNRGINDVDDKGRGVHRLARVETAAIEYFLRIRAGVIRLDIESQPEQTVWVPEVNVLQATADKILLPGPIRANT